MKTSFLLLFFVMLTHAAVAQEDFYNQYMIKVSGVGSTGGDPNINCQSGFEYSVIFENGDRSVVVPLVGVDGPGNTNFSGYIVFSSQNKVKSLFLHTKDQRKHGLSESCEGGTITDREIIFNPQYPCHNGTITHADGSYNFRTTIEIRPLSKKSIRVSTSFTMRNNANEEFANHPYINIYQPPGRVGTYKTNFSYSLRAAFENDSSSTLVSGGMRWITAGTAIGGQHSMIIPSTKKPVTLTLASQGTVDILVRTDTESGGEAEYTTVVARLPSPAAHNFTLSNLQVPGSATFNFNLYPNSGPGSLTVTAATFGFPVKYGPDNTNILPYDTANRITILGPAGNPPAFYHWVYSTDLVTWTNLPGKFQGRQRLSISGYDLMGEAFKERHNTNLFFKLVVDCTGGESDVLTLSCRISAPNIVSVVPMPDRCFDTPRDGAFHITFSRPLLVHASGARENLTILVRDLSNTNPPDQIINVTLDADNSLTWPRRLESGRQYEISLVDTYLGAFTFSDNKINHYDTLTLERPLPVTSIVTPEAVHCYGGADGKITIAGAGGAGNYSFEYVKPGGETLQGSFGTSATAVIDLLPPGTYALRLRDGNNCADRAGIRNVVITQPLSPLQIAYTAATDPRAYGYADGRIETIVTGGTAYPDKHYTVTWYDPSALLPESLQANAVLSEGYQANIQGLGDGAYILKTYDSQYEAAHPDHRAGCYAESEVFRLIQPAALVAAIRRHHEVKCQGNNDGALAVTAQGGIKIAGEAAPYLYIWFREENGVLMSIDRYDSVATMLTAGVYRVKIVDKNSIEKLSDAFVLTQPELLVAAMTTTPVSCNAGADGTAQLSALGGTAPYTYVWSVPGTEAQVTGLTASIYYGMVTDAKGCIAPASGTVQSPDLVTSEIVSDPAHCHGGGDGRIRLVAHGGSGTYHFSFGREGAMDVEGVAFTAGNSHVIERVSEGTYQVEVRDDNNCVDRVPVKTIYVAQPAPLEVKLTTIVNPRGYGYTDGSIGVVVSGGTAFADGRYSTQWYDPVNLLPETQYAGNSQPDGYHAQLLNIGDGNFYLQAYDSAYTLAHPDHRAGCTIKSEIGRVIQPPPLVVAIRERHVVSCHGFDNGEVEAQAGGGVKIETGLPYKYEWFKVEGAGLTPITQSDSIVLRLRSGLYQVRITDKNDVEKMSEPFFLVEPQPLGAQMITTPVSCNSGIDGTAFADVKGGTLPYQYAWSLPGGEARLTQLPEGRYFVAVSDSRGCKTSATGTVTSPYALKIDSLLANPQCYGYANGSIALDVRQGSAPYRYVWSNGETAEDIAGLPAGVYDVVIYDRNNCRNFRSYELKDPEPVRIELGGERYLCNDQAYEADASWPDTGVQYRWTGPGGFTAASAKVVLTQEGTYQVQATDARGCMGGDELVLKRIGTDIGAEFVVSTQAFADTEVTLLNLSTPTPDSSQWWVADRDDIRIVRQQDGKATVVFPGEGVYSLYLKAYRQGCEAIFSKTVTVLGASYEKDEPAETAFVEKFTASPNPTHDAFTVTVSLQEAASIRLRLLSMVSNIVVHDRRELGGDQYVLPYTVDLPPGIYLLMLETPGGSHLMKVIVY